MTFLKLVSSSNVVVRELWRQMGHCGDNNDDSGVDRTAVMVVTVTATTVVVGGIGSTGGRRQWERGNVSDDINSAGN